MVLEPFGRTRSEAREGSWSGQEKERSSIRWAAPLDDGASLSFQKVAGLGAGASHRADPLVLVAGVPLHQVPVRFWGAACATS